MAKTALFNINTLLSVLDPELRKVAQKWWAIIPDDSPLKSEFFERVFGVFKGWAETKARGMGPLGDVVEKLTDVGDFAVMGPKGVKAAQDWMDRFYSEAAKRIEKAADPKVELEKVKLDFELRRELLKVIEEARKAAEPAKPEKVSIDWQKMQDRFDNLFIGFAKAGGAVVRGSRKTDQQLARQLNRLADQLEGKEAR
ncbi:MAG: hypothetical protein G01um10142_27 [Parcubacteria group bacterium Gr01-1014_2]|nr:MAG: hypothetical protein G01um10142_27 [Parcubacteria group bacterium Gr01-1014_2]